MVLVSKCGPCEDTVMVNVVPVSLMFHQVPLVTRVSVVISPCESGVGVVPVSPLFHLLSLCLTHSLVVFVLCIKMLSSRLREY